MLFATNRTPKESARSRKGRKISFPPQKTRTSLDMYFCQRLGEHDYREIGSPAFFQYLKNLPNTMQVLLYIHGFNNTPEPDIFPNALRLQQLINQQYGDEFALVVPLIWPCDDDAFYAFIDDYWDDQRAADASGLAFARMLAKFDNWRTQEASKENPCTRRINILAHSMGNRVLRNAIASWGKYDHCGQVPKLFRNIFMVAADVVNHCLEPNNNGVLIPQSARNVIVYYANDDLAMPASKLSNIRHRTVSARLGMTGPEDLTKVAKNVYEVDCDSFNNRFDMPKGHSYFLNSQAQVSPALVHMLSAMIDGRVKPAKRSHILAYPLESLDAF
ncbi:alpha/beta hydrolase [Thalassotalea sp. 1_MG-2023]|uniref:alpha/beta hydrolase n=1 Tax=Thalassotalea sp. 1_MG-2023 TaxID=3062680 RepID=UPI0026E47FCD|nr:alpha/beta hydrolase [Thalassotalea sp. 1_MG-2023]MDO6426058.1 alpha/beta hydrolase [Thalassotalea sp. 1_MG-2023]